MAKTTRTFVFNTNRDRDLLEALDSLPEGEKSKAVREGLRLYLQQMQSEPTLAVVLEKLDAVYEMVQFLRKNGMAASVSDDDDPNLKNALLNLGL